MTEKNMNKLLRDIISREISESLLEKMTIEYELANPLLCEKANVYIDDDLNITLQVNRNEGSNDSYFKVYNHKDYRKADKVARINFRKPEYIYHVNSDGKKDWALNSRERTKLLEILNMVVFHGETVWTMLILSFNLEGGLGAQKTAMNKMDNLIYHKHLPIDLPIPDYTKLRFFQSKSKNY